MLASFPFFLIFSISALTILTFHVFVVINDEPCDLEDAKLGRDSLEELLCAISLPHGELDLFHLSPSTLVSLAVEEFDLYTFSSSLCLGSLARGEFSLIDFSSSSLADGLVNLIDFSSLPIGGFEGISEDPERRKRYLAGFSTFSPFEEVETAAVEDLDREDLSGDICEDGDDEAADLGLRREFFRDRF